MPTVLSFPLPITITEPPVEAAISPMQRRPEEPAERFPIVGLGGSAGSLAAFEAFFRAMPARNGMAFVVVAHLPPGQPSELPQVLAGFTEMPVQEAVDGLRLQPNQVYVIPPGCDMSVLHGTLLLFEPTLPAGRRLPIDFFLQSLAKDAHEWAAAVICSGMGADGTLGIKIITENFGLVLVQDPDTAAYEAMPRAALATEFVDFVLPAGQLPQHLLDYARQPYLNRLRLNDAGTASRPGHALEKIFLLIRTQTGHDFSLYKRNTVFRRIERRMQAHQISEFADYVRYLQQTPAEVETLFKELLIGVTKFFRDAEAFAHLQARLLPLLRTRPADSTIRVWAPGCSSGEEAYTLAMCLLECLDSLDEGPRPQLQIFASDINPDGIEKGRAGRYGFGIEADVSAARLGRFFTRMPDHYQIRKEVRDTVIFALHNVGKDAPFTRLDLLVCRNLLIYLSTDLQRHLLPVFHYALRPGGLLFLGPSENLTAFPELFEPLDLKWKISRRLNAPASLVQLAQFPPAARRLPLALVSPTPVSPPMPVISKENTFAALVERHLLRYHTPPAVVINAKGEVLYVNGRTGRYLEPAPGLGSLNVFDMAREELAHPLRAAVHQALTTHETVVLPLARVRTETGLERVRVTVQLLHEPELLLGLLLLIFEDQPTPRKARRGAADPAEAPPAETAVPALEKELHFTRQRLQNTVEEMNISLEELKSTNEELQSANEELQSTNEEAMTNKEEMQSLNEELMTLNQQYVHKSEELNDTASDMKNLLDATEIATIFLDNDLLIKRFTPATTRILPLLPADVGRPIAHFAANLRRQQLVQDVQQVLDRLLPCTVDVQAATGEWYQMRIMPYRTLANYINGAVVTFTERSAFKSLEVEVQAGRVAESMVEAVREPLLALDRDLRVITVSRAFARLFGLDATAVKGASLRDLDGGVWNSPGLRERIEALLADPTQTFDNYALTATFSVAGPRRLLVYGRNLSVGGVPLGTLLLGVEQE